MHIRQDIDGGFRRKFILHQRIGGALHRNPLLFRLVDRAYAALASVRNDKLRHEKMLKHRSLAGGGKDVSEYGAGDDKCGDLSAALSYALELQSESFGPSSAGESWALYQNQIDLLSGLVNEKRADFFYNFGICFAHVDAVLARTFPDVFFAGTDLSEHNAAFNRIEFADIKNLDVRCEDFFTHGPAGRENAVFWHSRTMCLLPSSFIKRVYQHAHKCGFKYIAGFEQNGLSEQTRTPYTFSKDEKDSLYWRDRMFIHNYPGILESCGYRAVHAGLFKTGHTSPDYQVLHFLGERAD